jgi:hypothetical protein
MMMVRTIFFTGPAPCWYRIGYLEADATVQLIAGAVRHPLL